jgi:hypothetical protein
VVCDPSTLRPLVAIDLHEESHVKPERQTRDEEVEALLRAAGLPVYGVLTTRTYDTRELEAMVKPHLSRVQ